MKKIKRKRTQNYKKHVGQVPGALVYTGNKSGNKLHIQSFDYNKDTVEETVLLNTEDAVPVKDTESVTWININGLHHIGEIEKIGKQYNLHPLVLEDIVNTTQRPKIDEYDNYLFVVLKMLYYDKNEEIINEQVSFVLGKNYVLTFQEAEGDVFDTVRDRLRYSKGRIRTLKSDYLLYALIDAVVDQYFSIIETLGNKIEDLARQISKQLNYKLERDIMTKYINSASRNQCCNIQESPYKDYKFILDTNVNKEDMILLVHPEIYASILKQI
jgi:magnesium transporter